MSRKWDSNVFVLSRQAEITLTPLSSLESARKKFLINPTYIMSGKWQSNVLSSGGRNDSNTALFARIGERKIFDELDVHHV